MKSILAAIIAVFFFNQANAIAFNAHSSFVDDQINAAIEAALAGAAGAITPTSSGAGAIPSDRPTAPAASRLFDTLDDPVVFNSTNRIRENTLGQWIDADRPLWGDEMDWITMDPGAAPEMPGVVYFFSGTTPAGMPAAAEAQVSVPAPGTLALLLPAALLLKARRRGRST